MAATTLSHLAAMIGGVLEGPDGTVTGLSPIEEAAADQLTWAEDAAALIRADASAAAAVVAPLSAGPGPKPRILTPHPRVAFARLLEHFAPPPVPLAGLHPTAIIGEGTEIAPDAAVGPYAVIGRRCRVGARAVIGAQAYIGNEVLVGDDSILHPQVRVMDRTVIGARVILHSGVVLGGDGFGFVQDGGRHRKIPQIGRVEIGDDVEIGANTTVDRATVGVTRIGRGTKIDNLVQIGHNCRIGEDCILVAQTGIAGSAVLGSGVTLAAQSGVAPHVTVGDGVTVAARGGVTKAVAAGQVVSGFPARPHAQERRIQAVLAMLPELRKRLQALEQRLEQPQDSP